MLKILSIATAALLAATPAYAAGFSLGAQSAESLGAAMAGAQADRAKPSAAFYNPASIVGVDGIEGSLSMFGAIVKSDYDTAEAMLLGVAPVAGASMQQAVIGDGFFPDAAIAFPISDRLYFGVSLNTPYGFDSYYVDDSILRYHGTASKVVSGALTSIIGYALDENWSIAAGFRVQYMDVSFDGAVDAAGIAFASMIDGFIPGTDDVFFALDADDFGFGYVIGFQGRLTERLDVGFSFSSKIEHEFRGPADFDLRGSLAGQTLGLAGLFQDTQFSAPMTTPAMYQAGASYEANERLTLLGSVTLMRWNKFEQIIATFDNLAQPPEVITQNWRDAWTGSLGAEYALSQKGTARFGVAFEQTPVNSDYASPRIPDADRVWIAAGYSHDLGEKATLHFGAAYVFIGDRPIEQSGALPENLFRGSASTVTRQDAVIVAAGLDFAF